MKSASCCSVEVRKTGAVSRMKSFQNCPGASSVSGGGVSRISRSSNPFSSSVPAKDSSTMNTTRCPRRRRTSPMPTQLLVGPNAPSGKKTTVDLSTLIRSSYERRTAGARAPVPALERQLLARALAGRVALVGGTLGFAERLAQQAADRAGGLAARPLPRREALVAAAAGVVGEAWDEEAQDRQQDADSDYDSDQHVFPSRAWGA